MSNNRKHKLERIIRYEYKCFDTLCYPKDNAKKLLRHMAKLLEFKVWYLYDIGSISLDEKKFMLLCNNLYYIYIDNIY